ncbi:MAG: DNA-3-methyladenine glycosylase 2 family protein [Rhodoblastus sp.]
MTKTRASSRSSTAGRKKARKPARKSAAGKARKSAVKRKSARKESKRTKPAGTKRASAKKVAPKRKRRRIVKSAPRVYAPGPAILAEDTLAVAVAALREIDPVCVGAMLEAAGPPPLRRREPGFAGLAWIVVGQQVSTASANAIYARLNAGFPGLAPQAIVAASEADLRACGLSAPKMKTLRAIADALITGALDLERLAAASAEDAHSELCAVHGIGPWTADIFLLFCLGHPDAWPAGDLALQEAARMALNLRKRPDTKQLEKIGERWRPHRGVAARLLWAYYRVMKEGRAGMALA